MLRVSLLWTAVVCLLASVAAQASAEEVLPAGMLLQCTLDEPNFSSRTAEVGDPVLCHVGALATFGRPVFPRGAYLAGRFQEYRDPGRLFGKGWIELAFDRVVLPDAISLPVSAKVISVPHLRVSPGGKIQGRGHPKRDALGWAIPVLWPVKLATLPARGPRPVLKGERRITVRLLEDVEVPTTVADSSKVPLVASAVPASTQEQSRGLRPGDLSEHPFEPQLTWLTLKDHTGYLVRDYWLEFGKLHCVTLDGERKLLPLARLDLGETRAPQWGTRSGVSNPIAG
jgi:hypothetical protein